MIVTLDGGRHACVVALPTEPQGSIIPCAEVVAFIRDELRAASGAVYDIRGTADADDAEMVRVGTVLNDAGYRFIGGHAVKFMAPPNKDR